MSETITRQIQGFCEGEMQKGDWSEFHINIGRQYPVKLATKKDEVKFIARAAGQQQAVWTFNESDGNPNTHRPGTFYKNRYLEAVVVGGQLDPTLAQAGQTGGANAPAGGGVSGGQTPRSDDERGRSIERQVIVKSALHLYPPAAVANAEDFWKLLDELAEWVAAEPDKPAEAPPGQSADDDDIPF